MATASIQARTEFASALNQVCTERGIDPTVVIETIKAAILAAYRKDNPKEFEGFEETDVLPFEVEIDPESGATRILKLEGTKKVDVTPPGFGRIAAQTAKQVILQRVREAEKSAIIDEYRDRVKSMITGMVLRFDGKNVIFDIGRGQGFMPPEDQVRSEFYKMNQRMAVYVKEIRDTMRGETIIVSRTVPEIVIELFRREVPEVNSGAVEVKAIAREAGVRTKIAVASTQSGVDPVGSCVGQKGVRVQEVINELNNEKIDIIQYSEDQKQFITASLSPAENIKMELDDELHIANVTVPDDQLSLAIGRGGQNVRLAAKLTGYKINLKGIGGQSLSVTGEEEFEIDQLHISPELRQALIDADIVTMFELEKVLDRGAEIPNVDESGKETLLAALSAFKELTVNKEKEVQKQKEVAEVKVEKKAKKMKK